MTDTAEITDPDRQRTWLERPDSYEKLDVIDMVEINSDTMSEVLLLRLWSVFRPDRKMRADARDTARERASVVRRALAFLSWTL